MPGPGGSTKIFATKIMQARRDIDRDPPTSEWVHEHNKVSDAWKAEVGRYEAD